MGLVLGMVLTTPAYAAPSGLPDVLLVTWDTTRADRIGAYGHHAARTPVFDRLAQRGRRYDRAYSPIPQTIPAHAALFTGRRPATLGLHANDGGLPQTELTLAERLKASGYRTAASVAATVTSRAWGFDQGFDAYFDDVYGHPSTPGQRPGNEVVDDLLAWWRTAGGGPRFAWVHLFDAHSPHVAPMPGFRDVYDAEVAFLDQQLGRLVDALDQPTLVVVVGDHGEGLGDHGEVEHGLFVYDSTQRVPLVMAGPGVERAVVREPVSLVDVAPTVLAHLGLKGLPQADGRVAPGDPPRPVLLESHALTARFGLAPHLGVVSEAYKLIAVPTPELYDLNADPAERTNLAQKQPDRVRRMAEHLGPIRVVPSGSTGSSGNDIDLLAQLGYVEPVGVAGSPGALDDPKAHIALIEGAELADALAQQGRFEEARSRLLQLHADYPDVLEVTVRLARIEVGMGKATSAVARLRVAADAYPDHVPLTFALAEALGPTEPAQAAALLETLAWSKPYVANVHARALAALARVPGTDERIVSLGSARLSTTPSDAVVAGHVGLALGRRGDWANAVPLLRQASKLRPPLRDVSLFLARIADESGQPAQARQLLEVELLAHPTNVNAALALAMVLSRGQQWEEVRVTVERTLAAVEPYADPSDRGVQMLRQIQAEAAARTQRP